MTIKFSGSQEAADADNNYPVAPEGTITYLTVVEAKESMSKGNREKGTPPRPMLELELIVAEGEFQDKVRVWNYLPFIEAGSKGHGMTLHAVHAFGFDPEGENEYSAEAFKGLTVKVELGVEVYKGKRKNVINKFIVDEGAVERKPVRDEAASFNPEELETSGAAAAPSRQPSPPPARPAAPPARKLPWGKK